MWAVCRGGFVREFELREGKLGGGWFLPVGLVLVAVDQMAKLLVEGRMRVGLEVPILPGFFFPDTGA